MVELVKELKDCIEFTSEMDVDVNTRLGGGAGDASVMLWVAVTI